MGEDRSVTLANLLSANQKSTFGGAGPCTGLETCSSGGELHHLAGPF